MVARQGAARDAGRTGIAVRHREHHRTLAVQGQTACSAHNAAESHGGIVRTLDDQVGIQGDGAVPVVAEAVVGMEVSPVDDQGVRRGDAFEEETAAIERDGTRAQCGVRQHIHLELAGVDDGAAVVGVVRRGDRQVAVAGLGERARGDGTSAEGIGARYGTDGAAERRDACRDIDRAAARSIKDQIEQIGERLKRGGCLSEPVGGDEVPGPPPARSQMSADSFGANVTVTV